MAFGGSSVAGERMVVGVFDDFGVALALLGLFFGVSEADGALDDEPLGVRLMLDFDALDGATGGFSKK